MQIKEYPGYNFIGLIFGPSSDTQKRLEKVCTLCVVPWDLFFVFISITNKIMPTYVTKFFLALK